VQLYLTAPARKLDKPAMELKGFAKTRALQPGETQTLSFVLEPRSLASFDSSISSWVADSGAYTIRTGASAKDTRQMATFSLDKELIVKRETAALAPKQSVNQIKHNP
jgi:beta-glucosidase